MTNRPASFSLNLSSTPCIEAAAYHNNGVDDDDAVDYGTHCVTIHLRWRNGYARVHLSHEDAGKLADTLGAASLACAEYLERRQG